MIFTRVNRFENELNEQRELLTSVLKKLDSVLDLKAEVNALATKVGQLPQPYRHEWARYSYPDLSMADQATMLVPSAPLSPQLTARISGKLALLPPPAARVIDHVTVCMFSLDEQYVQAYDADGKEIRHLCGWFRKIGPKVLAAFGNREWRIIPPGSKEWEAVYQLAYKSA